jgi:hypothetical protein
MFLSPPECDIDYDAIRSLYPASSAPTTPQYKLFASDPVGLAACEPVAEPAVEPACTVCDDTPSTFMATSDPPKLCATWTYGLNNNCGPDGSMSTSGSCRLSCYLAGNPLSLDDNCCVEPAAAEPAAEPAAEAAAVEPAAELAVEPAVEPAVGEAATPSMEPEAEPVPSPVAAEECATRECPADLTEDGVVSTNDLLALLAVFGRTDCDMDIIPSVPAGLINTDDLLTLLSQFGRSC